MFDKIRVFIVDDHPMVVEGIKSLLETAEGFVVSGSAYSGSEALRKLADISPDVVLTDINLPDMSGIDLCRHIKQTTPHIRVLGLSNFKERSYITRMVENGASGYLLKNIPAKQLETAIRMAYEGQVYMDPEVMRMIVRPDATDPTAVPRMTTREKEVLNLIAEGMTNGEISEKLFISPLTVDSHRKNLLSKFSVRNTAALVKFAMCNNLI
ncbi:MAG: response regulator transcription factor [Bacteroidia bacterium]|nr:response regulator transcription factor [Bacteroidia bacterium]